MLQEQQSDTSFPRWRLFAFLLLAVWTLTLTVSQHFSIPAEDNYRSMDTLGRFVLTFCFLSPIVFLCPRPVVLGALIISTLFQWGTLYYRTYMDSVPEIMVLINNAVETAEVSDAVWSMLPWHCLLFLVPALLLQIFLLYRHAPPKTFYYRRLKWSLCFVLVYGTLFGALFSRTGQSPSVGLRCARFGFLPTFTQDLIVRYFYLDTLREQALKNESKRSFGLQSEHQELTFGDIVVMQVESLDNAALDYQVNGKPVVPFLNSLQENSLTYRIVARKRYASAGADFEMLTGIPPLDGCFNYRIPGLPYNTALPKFFKEQGYETFCYHGVHGAFFNRRAVFTEMEFNHMMFCQDIAEAIRGGADTFNGKVFAEEYTNVQSRGAWMRDDVVLKTVLRDIHAPSERNRFFFVITATCHVPFPTTHIDGKDKLIPTETSMQDRYINSMHVVDGWLRSFYEHLPPGTLLIMYGDHTPKFRSGTFVSDLEGSSEFVPCFVHVVGKDLAGLQKVPRRPTETILSVRDVHSYLREITERDAVLTKIGVQEEDLRKANTDTPKVF